MKKWIAVLTACLLLTGCGAKPASPAETIAAEETLILYLPDDNAEFFVPTEIQVPHVDELAIVQNLKIQNVLKDEVELLNFGMEDKNLTLDFNAAFGQQINSMGTAGERMILGSVVNSFLTAFDAETVTITVEGNVLESGHAIYDEPLGFFE